MQNVSTAIGAAEYGSDRQPVPLDHPPTKLLSLDAALRGGPNTLLSPDDLMRILGYSRASLARWRKLGTGPAFVKLSRNRVAYRAQDVADHLCARRITRLWSPDSHGAPAAA